MSQFNYTRIRIDKKGSIAEVVLNRPQKLNVMDHVFFDEIGRAFEEIDQDQDVYVAIVWAEGKIFTAGLDLKSSADLLSGDPAEGQATKNARLYKRILHLQKCFSNINKCKKV